jgi:hypothetical protein
MREDPELTLLPLLWNHPKIVGVAQALLPVRFSGTHKPLREPVLGLESRSLEIVRSNFCTGRFVR